MKLTKSNEQNTKKQINKIDGLTRIELNINKQSKTGAKKFKSKQQLKTNEIKMNIL